MHVLTAPRTIRTVAWAAVAALAAVVAYTGSAGVTSSMAATTAAGMLAAAATLIWIRRQPLEEMAARMPRAIRLAFDHAPKLMSGEAFPAFRNPPAIAVNGSVPGIVFKLGLFGVPHMGFEAMRIVGWLYTLVVIGGAAWLALRARPQGREPLVWLAILVLTTMRSPFLPTYAAFPTSWLAVFGAALAWRDGRPVWPWAAAWLMLAVGFGAGGIDPLTAAVWTTLQTILAFALLIVVMRQLRASGEPAATADARAPVLG